MCLNVYRPKTLPWSFSPPPKTFFTHHPWWRWALAVKVNFYFISYRRSNGTAGGIIWCSFLPRIWQLPAEHVAIAVATRLAIRLCCMPLHAVANAATAAYVPTTATTIVSAAAFCWLLPVIQTLFNNLPPPPLLPPLLPMFPLLPLRLFLLPLFVDCCRSFDRYFRICPCHHRPCHHWLHLQRRRHNRHFCCWFLLMVLYWLLPVYSMSNSSKFVPLRRVGHNMRTSSCRAE